MFNRAICTGSVGVVLTMIAIVGCQSTERREQRVAGPVDTYVEPPSTLVPIELPPNAIWLDALDLSLCEAGWGTTKANRSIENHPLIIGSKRFDHGMGAHAYGELRIDLFGDAREFRTWVGVDADSKALGSVQFIVLVDNREVYRSPIMRGGDEPIEFVIDLRNARYLTLVSEEAGDDINYDHADWAGAMIILQPGARQQPVAVAPPPEPEPEIARGVDPRPRINAPHITGATPGRQFLFLIPASGASPLEYKATGLPPGLALDPTTGIISGMLHMDGKWDVAVAVTGPRGQARGTLTIVGGDDALALTPPMGWNSWNVWGLEVDEQKVRDAADWIVKSGLAAHGFQYINIDDGWEAKERDAKGFIRSNEKFPDMKRLADYVHSRGLKLGIYSSPGPRTCGQYTGSYQHERQDAQKYAEWGMDLLKYDWCSYDEISKGETVTELQHPYIVMREALDAVDRDIVYSLCQYGRGDVWMWGDVVGGHYWRTTGDITDNWASMATIGFGQAGHEVYAKPGNWNDPDMLVVGRLGWDPARQHNTKLTKNEQLTHMTLWSLQGAPLLIGCDLTQLDEFTLALLRNPEVLDVNQDVLGKTASRIAVDGQTEVWARPLADGSLAVGLFNRGREPARVAVNWSNLKITGTHVVRDLWKRKNVGLRSDGFEAEVPRHGAVMIKVSPPIQDAGGPQSGDR